MMAAKTGNWFVDNPQRGRSNNSALLIRDELTRVEWSEIMKSVKDYGEPGFIFAESKEFMFNPCVEIGMMPKTEDGRSGFQFCNLTEINGGACVDVETFERACKAASILGTLQAGYTNFKYVSKETKEITEQEALIGVSVTGWVNNPDVLFVPENMENGANLVKKINVEVAKLIGVNIAARTTCVKPSGNASVILGTASGIHGEHSQRYYRHVQMNAEDEVAKILQDLNPAMVEKSVWSSNGTDVVVAFPVESKEGSLCKSELLGVKQLDLVKLVQKHWVETGTNYDLCMHPHLRHNVSNTITVDNWDEVEDYIYDNREWFAGISLLSYYGDKAYVQAPFTEVPTLDEFVKKYGIASVLASGLVVDGLHAFSNNLWLACDTAMGFGLKLDEVKSEDVLKIDWVRRFKKFAKNHLHDDLSLTSACLKDCYNLHKWEKISNEIVKINFSKDLYKKKFTEASSLGGQACAGGTCELTF
jgi:ribonucleoside-diphosphate reductase alpha chain